MNSREEAVIERDDPIATTEDLAAALAARFVANAEAGHDSANAQLIDELAAWRRRSTAEPLPYRLPGSHEVPAAPAQEAAQPTLDLLRRVREGLIHLPPTEFATVDLDELEAAVAERRPRSQRG